jgi:hypothetical protein
MGKLNKPFVFTFRTMTKIPGFIALIVFILFGCNNQNYPQSVFFMKDHTKLYLRANGFIPFKPKIKGMNIPANGSKLWKIINDTSVLYEFQDTKLMKIIITISLTHSDTGSIFTVLASLGFKKRYDSGGIVVNNSKEIIQYQIIVHNYDILFINTINRPEGTGFKRDSVVSSESSP